MVRHYRAMSGTIPSMETQHDDLKDNTIIIGRYPLNPVISQAHFLLSLVLGASGDLAKKKVFWFPFRLVSDLKCLLDITCALWPLSLGFASS